ncbi:MAG: EpsI family protein, partial [Planctomycetales bacterium]
MKQSYSVAFLVLVAATLSSGALHGTLSRRWGNSQEARIIADRLATLPPSLDGWELENEAELDPEALRMLQCDGYAKRVYRHAETGRTAHVAVLVGPAGPMVAHTPEICFSTRDYVMESKRKRVEVGDGSRLWTTRFRSHSLDGERVQVYFGWTGDGVWSAPDHPRLAFGGQPWLVKIQAAVNASSVGEADETGDQFLRSLLPV